MNYWIFIIPLVSAFIGWLIHSIAIHFFISKILPRKKFQITDSIAEIANREFARFPIEEKINDPKNLESILPVIEAHIDTFLNEKLKQEMPVISMFIGNKTTDKLKEVFMKEIQALFPQVIGKFASNLKSGIDVKGLILKKVEAMDDTEIKKLIENNLGAELRALKTLGAVAGFTIGIIQVIFLIITS